MTHIVVKTEQSDPLWIVRRVSEPGDVAIISGLYTDAGAVRFCNMMNGGSKAAKLIEQMTKRIYEAPEKESA